MEELTRICRICNVEKAITSFSQSSIQGKTYRRRACSSCLSKRWNEKNRDKRKKIDKRANQKYNSQKPEFKLAIFQHINQAQCKNCGCADIDSLCFHHRNPEEKSYTIKWGMSHSVGLDSLKIEAEKCDVLCGNCHMLHHYLGKNCKNNCHALRAIRNLEIKENLMHEIPALAFCHHFDKKFNISMNISMPFDELLVEAKKCKVLCINCLWKSNKNVL